MCYTIIQTYESCRAEIHVHNICHEHIAHTHKQIDDKPCPDHVILERFIESSDCACALYANYKCKTYEENMEENMEYNHKYRFEIEKDDLRKYRRTERLARAERERLTAEQEEIEREAERKQRAAGSYEKRRRLGDNWTADFDKIDKTVSKFKIREDTPKDEPESSDDDPASTDANSRSPEPLSNADNDDQEEGLENDGNADESGSEGEGDDDGSRSEDQESEGSVMSDLNYD